MANFTANSLPRKKTVRFLKWLLPIFLIAGIGIYATIYMKTKEQEQFAQTINARKVKVVRRDIKKILYLTGKVLPSSSISIYSPVSGQIVDILVKEGDEVKAEQALFAVKQDTTAQKELEARRNDVDKARLELRDAEENLSRIKSVKELFSTTEQEKNEMDFNRKKLEFEAATERLNLLEEALGLKNNNAKTPKSPNRSSLSTIFVKSPRKSYVTFISKAIGDAVIGTSTASQTTDFDVLTLSDVEKMMVRAKVLESDLELVKIGMNVEVRLDAFKAKSYKGKITRISQQGIEDKSGGFTYFQTDVTIVEKDENVRAQMNASLQIAVAEKKNTLALPVDAIASAGEYSVIETLPENLNNVNSKNYDPKYKQIKTALSNEEFTEILEGELTEGEEVLKIDFAKIDPKKLAAGQISELNAAKDSNKKIRTKPGGLKQGG